MKPILLFHPNFGGFSFHDGWFTGTVRRCMSFSNTEDLPCFVPFQYSSAPYELKRGGPAASRRVASVCGRRGLARRPPEETNETFGYDARYTCSNNWYWNIMITIDHITSATVHIIYLRATCCISMKCYEYRRDVLRIITGSYWWVLASAILSTHTHTHTPLGILYAYIYLHVISRMQTHIYTNILDVYV